VAANTHRGYRKSCVRHLAPHLGHSTTRLTQDTYQHVLPGMQERAARKLDAIFRQPEQVRKAIS
jgi:integrase